MPITPSTLPFVKPHLSVIDAGVEPARAALAFEQTVLHDVAAGGRGPLLRFCRLRPAVLIGRHQWPDTEVRREFCRAEGIEVVRRGSGGGAVYVDEGQLFWSLVLAFAKGKRPGLAFLLAHACRAVALGLRRLGVSAESGPISDVEVGGRKLATVYVAVHGDAVLLHGTVLTTVDVERALKALRLPTEKLSQDGLEGARRRLAALSDLLRPPPPVEAVRRALTASLSRAFGLTPRADPADSSPSPLREPVVAPDGMETPEGSEVFAAFYPCNGRLLRVRYRFDPETRRMTWIRFAGDVMIHPPDLFERLANSLEGTGVDAVLAKANDFIATADAELVGLTPADVSRLLARALDRLEEQREFGLAPREANRLTVCGPANLSARDIALRASHLLVPYCAKLPRCKWRYRDGCTECGLCEVGDAYRLARERGMQVITITDYEHLCRTLDELRRKRVTAYLGMCCAQFFIKRNRAFGRAGIPCLLMDIEGSNCYDLQQEEKAYAGRFEAKARLDIPLLRRVMRGSAKVKQPA